MRKFKVRQSNDGDFCCGEEIIKDYYYISVCEYDLLQWYKIYKQRRNGIIKKYNGIIDKYTFIIFNSQVDTQNFIDNVLIPHEIAFNLNEELLCN